MRNYCLLAGLFITLILLVLSGLHPYDRTTWIMEVLPVGIAVPVLLFTHNKFPLTSLVYICLFAHACVLMLGGAYTYARVPLGFEIAELLNLQRNPYDKIGHFFQGFVPALLAREILIRGQYVNGQRILGFLILCIVLAISSAYELIEWAAAIALGQGADDFLGTQGDPWDTQSDMFFALCGAVVALLGFARWHDQQLKKCSCA